MGQFPMNLGLVRDRADADCKATADDRRLILEMYHRLECAVGLVLQRKNLHEKSYAHIPFGNVHFIQGLQSTRQWISSPASELKFLDVGCGIGTKVFLAQSLGFDAYGLEWNAPYLEVARKFYKDYDEDRDPTFIEGNALEFNRYDQYDIIYWYGPISRGISNEEIAALLLNQMKPGAILFSGDKHYVQQVSRDFKHYKVDPEQFEHLHEYHIVRKKE